jgi:hypothetical protein
MNLKSPIFGEVGSYSYPFKLPNTPRNATLLGFKHRVENTGDVYETDQGMFLWNGLNLFQGTMKIKTLSNKSFEGSIFEGTGDFNYQVKNLNLRQIDFGELTFATDLDAIMYINNCINKFYPDRAICFPEIANETYLDPATSDPNQMFFNRYITGVINQTTPLGNPNLIVPMLYMRYVLARIFLQLGYNFDDSLFTSNADYNKLAIFNSLCINSLVTEFTYDIKHIYFNLHLPAVSLADFFKAIGLFFNASFFVNYTTNTVKLIPVNSIVADTAYSEYSKNVISVVTDLEDQVTGYSLKLELDGADPVFEVLSLNEEHTLKSISGSVNTFADLPVFPLAEIGEIRYVIDLDQYWFFTPLKFWTSIVLSQDIFSQFIYKAPTEDISIGLSSLLSEDFLEYACSCGNAFSEYRDISPRIFFAAYNSVGDTRMYALNRTSNFGFFFNQPNNPYLSYWKEFIEFRMATKLVKITRQMTFIELKEFDFSRKIMVNGNKYLVKSLQVTLKKDRIMPALLECYTCN